MIDGISLTVRKSRSVEEESLRTFLSPSVCLYFVFTIENGDVSELLVIPFYSKLFSLEKISLFLLLCR